MDRLTIALRNALSGAFTALYPPVCVLCGAPGANGLDLCRPCRAELPGIDPCCPRCAQPLGPGHPVGQPCGRCQRHPPPYTRCRALLRYQGPVPMLVGGLKFRKRMDLLRLLGTLLGAELAATLPREQRPDAIVPVPLHPRRLRQRGYNQALELARGVARQLDLPLDPGCCARVRATPPQAELERAARLHNLHGAFAARGALSGRRLAILDDVVTTGSTVAELTRVLRRAGALEVEVWALARTP